MKIISWNVNGIRSILKKGFTDFVRQVDPDILCLQETKAPSVALDNPLPEYNHYWNSAQKPGYSGTAIFSKTKPLSVTAGIGMEKHDNEGRVLTAEYPDFYVVNVYVPNSKRDLSRLGYRTQEWDLDFLKHLKNLEAKKPVVFCGDLNVAHKEIDLTYPATNRENHGFTDEERAGFDRIVESGFIDTFREFVKAKGHYTWWSPMAGCRAKNIGWRIDYFCISPALRARLKSSTILPHILGSDHCPIQMEI